MGGRFYGAVFVSACGAYVPRLRIGVSQYKSLWGTFAAPGVNEKTVAGFDEDAVTMAVEAARAALDGTRKEIRKEEQLQALYLASTTLPYAEKVQASTVAAALGIDSSVFCSEHTTSVRSGTEALISAAHQVAVGGGAALVVASEAPALDPRDGSEHVLGAGAVAVLLGVRGWARLLAWYSITQESLGIRFRPAGSREIGNLDLRAYSFEALTSAVGEALKGVVGALSGTLNDYRYVILPQPDGPTPLRLARKLGLNPEQVEPGLVVSRWGDCGSAMPLLSFAMLGSRLQPGDRVLLTAYGPGLAADALALEVTEQPAATIVSPRTRYIGFGDLLRFR